MARSLVSTQDRCTLINSTFLIRFDVIVELYSIVGVHVDKVDSIADIREFGSHYRAEARFRSSCNEKTTARVVPTSIVNIDGM